MSRRRITVIAFGLIITLLLAGIAAAQISPNFDLHWSFLNSGGGERLSASNRVQDSLGQWVAGVASSANYRLEGGFLPGAVAPLSPDVTATRSGSAVALMWRHNSTNASYQIRRGTDPYFATASGTLIGDGATKNCTNNGVTVTCTDTNAIGDPDTHHFYMVRAFNSGGASADSNRVGEFDFELVAGNP
jgi:hypothetical protein